MLTADGTDIRAAGQCRADHTCKLSKHPKSSLCSGKRSIPVVRLPILLTKITPKLLDCDMVKLFVILIRCQI